MTGKLYIVGVGPGHHDHMTFRAKEVISESDTIVGYETYVNLVQDLIGGKTIHRYAMTQEVERAHQCIDLAKSGKIVSLVSSGDPGIYGMAGLIYETLATTGWDPSDELKVEIIPGVTSVTACAAAAKMPLLARNEHLTVIPGTLEPEDLRSRILNADAVVIMKVGRHLDKIKKVLGEVELSSEAVYVEYASLPAQKVLKLKNAPKTAPYFSMILVAKGADPWL